MPCRNLNASLVNHKMSGYLIFATWLVLYVFGQDCSGQRTIRQQKSLVGHYGGFLNQSGNSMNFFGHSWNF